MHNHIYLTTVRKENDTDFEDLPVIDEGSLYDTTIVEGLSVDYCTELPNEKLADTTQTLRDIAGEDNTTMSVIDGRNVVKINKLGIERLAQKFRLEWKEHIDIHQVQDHMQKLLKYLAKGNDEEGLSPAEVYGNVLNALAPKFGGTIYLDDFFNYPVSERQFLVEVLENIEPDECLYIVDVFDYHI